MPVDRADDDYQHLGRMDRVYADDRRFMIGGEAGELVGYLVAVCDAAPDDEHLLAIAVLLIDPLLDLRWSEVGEDFEAAMTRSSSLRKAFSGSMPDVPQEDLDRLEDLVLASESIGRRPLDPH